MRPNLNPNYPSTRVVIFSLGVGLGLLVIGISNIFIVRDELTTGQAYRVSVVFGDGTKVSRSGSPVQYWYMVGMTSLACAGGIGGGLWVPISTVMDYRKKLARQRKERGKQ